MEERTLKVTASVRVTVDTKEGRLFDKTRALELEIPLLALALPEFAMLLRHTNLTGAWLMGVPSNSPHSTYNDVIQKLKLVSALVDRMLDPVEELLLLGKTVAWLLGLHTLREAIDTVTGLPPLDRTFQIRDEYKDLHDNDFIDVRLSPSDWESWRPFNDKPIADRGSSTLILSQKRKIIYYEHKDFGGSSLTVDPNSPIQGLVSLGVALVHNLHSKSPASVPPGCTQAKVVDPIILPGIGILFPPKPPFGDVISSYKWS